MISSLAGGLPSVLPTYKVQMLEKKKASTSCNPYTILVCFCVVMLVVVIISNLIAFKDLQDFQEFSKVFNEPPILTTFNLRKTNEDRRDGWRDADFFLVYALEEGTDLKYRHRGYSYLMMASRRGHLSIVELLLSKGANNLAEMPSLDNIISMPIF